uniref:Transposase n=1 Tax=Cereibacter sphaeroides (strain ATCC 17025 / ATH 2.4.3) TaxID=349102 RepID=A4WPS1_CERS5
MNDFPDHLFVKVAREERERKERDERLRQFVLGVVQTADGLPLMHIVHPGNVAETKTLQAMLTTVLQRFPIERIVLVADRGLLSSA